MTNFIQRPGIVTALAAVAAFTIPATGRAQTSDPRWEAWTGCWEATVDGMTQAGSPLLCVVPTRSGAAVEVATIEKGAVVSRDTLDASGAPRAFSREGCSGTTTGRWSADNRRIYVKSDLTCAGGLKRSSNRIASIGANHEFLDVESVNVGGSNVVRAAHYRDVGASRNDVPAEFASLAKDRGMSVSTARAVAAGTLEIPAIAEAVKQTDTLAVQTWIVERGARFTELRGEQLAALADLGVPGSVTDVMVGISYPEHFALDRRAAGGASANGTGLSRADSARIVSEYMRRCGYGVLSAWSAIYDPACDYGGRYRGYGSYYGYPYSQFGYYGGYYNPYYSPYYSGPVVIVRGEQREHGQVVKGQGYRCGSCSTSGTSGGTRASGSTTSSYGGSGGSSGSSSGSSGGGSGSSGSSGTSSSSGASSGGRTAVPRPPL